MLPSTTYSCEEASWLSLLSTLHASNAVASWVAARCCCAASTSTPHTFVPPKAHNLRRACECRPTMLSLQTPSPPHTGTRAGPSRLHLCCRGRDAISPLVETRRPTVAAAMHHLIPHDQSRHPDAQPFRSCYPANATLHSCCFPGTAQPAIRCCGNCVLLPVLDRCSLPSVATIAWLPREASSRRWVPVARRCPVARCCCVRRRQRQRHQHLEAVGLRLLQQTQQ